MPVEIDIADLTEEQSRRLVRVPDRHIGATTDLNNSMIVEIGAGQRDPVAVMNE